MCEADDDDFASNWWQATAASEETQLPRIVSVRSLSVNDGSSENNSNTDTLPAAAQQPVSSVLSKSGTRSKKINMECSVVLEKLPDSLVQAATDSTIIVSNSFNTSMSFLKSCGIGRSAPTQTYLLSDCTVKIEPPEPTNDVENIDQASVPCQITQQNIPVASYLLNVNGQLYQVQYDEHSYLKKTVDKTSVATMTDAVPPNANTGTLQNTNTSVRSDISVILLNSAQKPKAAMLDATNPLVSKQPEDLLRVVQRMLQQQNISPLPLSDNDSSISVMCDENKQRGKMPSGCVNCNNAARLRKVLTEKLEEEQAKVKYLLAQVISLTDTIKQLSSNSSTGVECTPVSTGNSFVE